MLIFLGGTAGNSSWRKAIAIPMLEAAGIHFFNPQVGVGEWTPELQKQEAKAKAAAAVWLFVISNESRGVASLVEAAYRIGSGGKIALAVLDMDADTMIDDSYLSLPEVKDLNRGRAYLREIAEAHGCQVFQDVRSATEHAIQLAHELENRS